MYGDLRRPTDHEYHTNLRSKRGCIQFVSIFSSLSSSLWPFPLFPSIRKLQRNLQKPNPTQRKSRYPSINHMEKSSKATPTTLKSWARWYDLFYGILHTTHLKEEMTSHEPSTVTWNIRQIITIYINFKFCNSLCIVFKCVSSQILNGLFL